MNSRRTFLGQLLGLGALALGIKPIARSGTLVTMGIEPGIIAMDKDLLVTMGIDTGAAVPEHWAREGMEILEENMVVSELIHKDFVLG